MTTNGIPAAGPGDVLRLTWVRDQLAHILQHCDNDEPSGTWTGRACPDHGLAAGADADLAAVRQLSARGQLADLIWEAPAGLTAEHSQLFRAAIQAYHAGQAEAAEQIWQQLGTVWSRACAANPRRARADARRWPGQVLPGQAAALGGGLLRAPLRPALALSTPTGPTVLRRTVGPLQSATATRTASPARMSTTLSFLT